MCLDETAAIPPFPMTTTRPLALSAITFDSGCQLREASSDQTVEEYAEAMSEGSVFPPITVFFDGANYYLADGYHRFLAVTKRDELNPAHPEVGFILAEVRMGTRQDAIRFALKANAKHGLKRSPADNGACDCTDFTIRRLPRLESGRVKVSRCRHCTAASVHFNHLIISAILAQNGEAMDSGRELEADPVPLNDPY